MKVKELIKKIKSFKLTEIDDEILKAKKERDVMYLEVRAGKFENYSKILFKRKEIARLKTIKVQMLGEISEK